MTPMEWVIIVVVVGFLDITFFPAVAEANNRGGLVSRRKLGRAMAARTVANRPHRLNVAPSRSDHKG